MLREVDVSCLSLLPYISLIVMQNIPSSNSVACDKEHLFSSLNLVLAVSQLI